MSSNNAQLVRFEALRSLGFASVSGTYAAVGTAFLNACRILQLDNLSNANVIVSFDGINDHLVVAGSSGKVLDFSANKVLPAGFLAMPAGTIVYIKQETGAPTSGSFYVSVMYAGNF